MYRVALLIYVQLTRLVRCRALTNVTDILLEGIRDPQLI